jgi:Cft2 family RNA processing exonuclease
MSQHRTTFAESGALLSCSTYGVGHGNEGICLLVKMGPYRILLDCGLENVQSLKTGKTPPVDWVFCSHAHQDHAKGLLDLHRAYPQLPIYASHVTVQLLPLNWLDDEADIPDFCQGWKWRSPIKLFPDLTAEIFPSGHLPGAALLLLTYKTSKRNYKLLYTGDFSLSNFQLVEGLSVELLRGLAPDVLIIEGSYGTMRHPHRRQQEKQLMTRLYEVISQQKNILLPVPTLGLGQEILKLLRSHHQFTGRDLDIWVDGMIATACDVYLELLPEFPSSVQNFAKHQPLFWDERICPRMGRLTESKRSQIGITPCIVLTDQIDDLQQYCLEASGQWLVLIPEHFPHVISLDHPVIKALKRSRQCQVETYLLSEHSDSRNTTQLIHNLRPQHVIFIHGSPNYLADLTSLEELQNRYQLHSPSIGALVELPIGEKFIQPLPPTPSSYEGELNEVGTTVTITLPDTITQDPRWTNFADTGLVEARWQGEDVILRGLSQRELLSEVSTTRGFQSIDCCQVCCHQKGQRCWNPTSPLYGLRVVPEGYCPVFEPIEES